MVKIKSTFFVKIKNLPPHDHNSGPFYMLYIDFGRVAPESMVHKGLMVRSLALPAQKAPLSFRIPKNERLLLPTKEREREMDSRQLPQSNRGVGLTGLVSTTSC